MQQYQAKELITISCCLDDLNPELYPQLIEDLVRKGANDAWLVPIIMKKGRPGIKLEVLCDLDTKNLILDEIFKSTTTLGVRISLVNRIELERKEINFEIDGFKIRAKAAYLPDGSLVNLKAEYEDCKSYAENRNISLKHATSNINTIMYERFSK